MKTYNITIDMLDNITGLDAISLVERPAVEYNFISFNTDKPMIMQFTDDEKHIISGVALLADVPILRVNEAGEQYQVVFSKDVIRQLVEKYSLFRFNNNVNIEHNNDEFVNGVIMTESYIIDRSRGICPTEFSDVTDGSWIVSYKVENNEVWNRIKSGEVKGFSVQGFFNLVDEQIKFTQKNKKFNKMGKSLRNALKTILLAFSEVETDKGFINWYGDKQLEVGDEVFVGDEPAADGEYKAGNSIFVIAEGKVVEIKDAEMPEAAEPAAEPAPEAMKKRTCMEEMPAEPVAEPTVEEVKEEVKEEVVAEVKDEVAEKIAALEARIAALEAKIAEPAAEPVVEEFNNALSSKYDNLNMWTKIASASRK